MITLRIATAEDGPTIGALIGVDRWDAPVDWSSMAGQWIVAEDEGETVGCIAALAAPPIGHAEHLGVRKGLGVSQRARVVRELLYQAWASLRMAGCGLVVGTVPRSMPNYVEVLERRGGAVIDQANVMIKRLA